MCRKFIAIALVMSLMMSFPVYATESKPAEWARPSVESLKEIDFFRYPEFLDEYQMPITRGEFAVLLASMYETLTGEEIAYNDARRYLDLDGNPYVNEIGKASGYNFVTGASYYQYQPDDILTREWAASYAHRLLLKLEYENTGDTYDVIFSDMFNVSFNCWQSVEYLVANGFMSGVGNQIFNPGGVLTREQAYSMMWRIYSQLA